MFAGIVTAFLHGYSENDRAHGYTDNGGEHRFFSVGPRFYSRKRSTSPVSWWFIAGDRSYDSSKIIE